MHRRRFFSHFMLLPLGLLAAGLTRPACFGTSVAPPEPWRLGPDVLARWRRAARHPIVGSADPLLGRIAASVRRQQRLRFRYQGGSTPGAEREVSPGLLFTAEGFDGVYFSGHCYTRRAERIFLVARMGPIVSERTYGMLQGDSLHV